MRLLIVYYQRARHSIHLSNERETLVSAILVDGVSKRWGDITAVDNVTFEAPQGRFTVLLGPSGCGKSTTLRLISGLDRVSSGRIHIGDRDVTDTPSAQRDLSMVFQSYALFPHLSTAENILFGLKVRKVPKTEQRTRLRQTAELLGITDLLHRRPAQLSGGQQQRVALGRAIIAEKPLCLMDEPLSNLDAKLRHEMRQEIRALQRKLGISMVYVTHDQAEAMSMADQVVLLREGRVEQIATPEEIYQRPASLFVARFIGTPPMNVVRLRSVSGGAVIDGLDGPPVVSGVGAGLSLGVRPEDIRLKDGAGIPAVVEGLEYLGADSIVDCSIGSQTVSVRAHGRVRLEPGEPVQLSWRKDSVHVFDTSSGARRDGLEACGFD